MQNSFLSYKSDRYNGVIVDEKELPNDPILFEKLLKASLEHWISEKKRGIWLKIPVHLSFLITAGINEGFRFHHCQTDYLMLVKWISSNEKDNIPNYATHFIGVGGVVLKEETHEILVVKEKVSVIKDFWKIPGGHVEFNEFLPEAAIREVFEETGVETEFVSLMAFRETKDYKFGMPDIYFVCLLKPKTFDLKKCEQEIKDVKWMKIEEFVEFYKISQFHSKIGDLLIASLKGISDKGIEEGKEKKTESIFWKAENFQFKYGEYLRNQIIYYSELVPQKKE